MVDKKKGVSGNKSPEKRESVREFIIGLGGGHREYHIGDVTYVVSNKFQMPSWDGTDKMLSDRIADIVGSEFADLSIPKEEDRMEDDLKRSAAGKGAKDRDER